MNTEAGYGWRALRPSARAYVAAVVIAGISVMAGSLPLSISPSMPHPPLFIALLAASCLTSLWKVNLPIPLGNGSTLSVSYAADLTALLLLGPRPATVIAVAGVWTQCTFKVKCRYPLYRTVFSMAVEALTMWATGLVYLGMGGTLAPNDFDALSMPLVGAIATYFVVNTELVAYAIACSTDSSFGTIWRHDFLWSGVSFVVAGTAGGIAAVTIARGAQWKALLMVAPVYLIYKTYQTIVGRLEDERRHLEETRRLHEQAVGALAQARRTEQALEHQKRRLAITLGSITDGVIATDPDGTIVLMNGAAEAMTGWTGDEAAGRPLTTVFQSLDPDTRRRLIPLEASASAPAGPYTRSCTLLVGRDLRERPIEECVSVLRDDREDSMGMVLVFRDISDTLKIQEERARANKLSALGLLAGGLGRDFNNILMAISGNISMARTVVGLSGIAAAALTEAERACVRARQLTWQLLTFSQGGIPLRRTVKLADVLKESLDTALGGSRVACTLDIARDLWTVEADAAQLVQVFSNVVANARQAASNRGTIAIRAENVVESEWRSGYALRVEPGRYVRVTIMDRGVGIPRERLGRIFDPYFSTKDTSSGLGLAVTHSIVKHHGGFVAVDSHVGRGTTMCIDLPASASEMTYEEQGPIRSVVQSHRRVLVVDDEAALRTLTVNMLEFLGYQAEVVESGRAAVERFRRALKTRRPFDVVMLDLVVPGGMGPVEIRDRLARLDPTVKAVLVSGQASRPDVTDYRDHGFGARIVKPFTLQELNSTLCGVLGSSPFQVH